VILNEGWIYAVACIVYVIYFCAVWRYPPLTFLRHIDRTIDRACALLTRQYFR